jgi:phage gpG-like protein
MIDFAVDAAAATLKLRSIAPKARAAANAVIADTAAALSGSVRHNIAAAGLHDGSGTLARSIRLSITDDGEGTTARVYTDASIAYARIQEYGGRISMPEIVPEKAKALAFEYAGKLVFAEHVKAHDVTIPARPFMRPSLADITPTFQDGLRAAIAEALA